MSDRLARRQFLGALALVATAAPLALALPRALDAAGECELEGRDLRPHKGFASTRENSGGQCTTHAARRFDTVAPDPGVNWRGNAAYWYDNAREAGWVVGDNLHAARPGAVVVWSGGAGHVAFIERVTDEGIEVSEMNWSQQMCSWSTRFRTSAWGRLDHASLTWDEVRMRLWHPFVGYVYPVRREISDF
jgi:surface antigen